MKQLYLLYIMPYELDSFANQIYRIISIKSVRDISENLKFKIAYNNTYDIEYSKNKSF